jgi:DNA-binding IscR family transcriptional regulator
LLAALGERPGEPLSSSYLAKSVNTNAVVIRRLLAQLAAAGMTISRLGAGGGSVLIRNPEEITLAQVYRSVHAEGMVASPRTAGAADCPIAQLVHEALKPHVRSAEGAFITTLERATLADVLSSIRARSLSGAPA